MRKDVSSVSPKESPQGKLKHVIEVCNCVDAGTSVALLAQAREEFHEQTAMEAVITFLQTYARPYKITFDRDPRLSSGAVRDGTFLPLCAVFCCVWGASPTAVRRIGLIQTRLLKDCIERWGTSVCSSTARGPARGTGSA